MPSFATHKFQNLTSKGKREQDCFWFHMCWGVPIDYDHCVGTNSASVIVVMALVLVAAKI